MRLLNKNILVTGASQGIGKSTSIVFANNGANVHALDIDEKGLNELKNINSSIKTYKVDVTDKKELEHLIKNLDCIEVLFNCVGFVHNGDILNCSINEWNFSLNVNITSMYLLTKLCLPPMLKRKKGNVINVSSVASSIKGVKNRFVYSVTKAAVIGFSKSIAADFAELNIRCNVICPGTISSPSLKKRIQTNSFSYKNRLQTFIDRQPMCRIGTPLEVANLSLYLASDESSYTTGSVNIIDGGWSN